MAPRLVGSPRKLILSVVFGAVVSGLSAALSAVATGFYAPVDAAFDAFAMAGDAVDGSVGAAASSIIRAERAVTGIFVDLGARSGLAAPLTTVAIVGITFGIVLVVAFAVVQVVRLVNPQ